MINKTKVTEFGAYVQYYNHGYKVNSYLSEPVCIDAYKGTPDHDHWSDCPCCGLKPKIWIFDNGRSTVCGCANDRYDHFSVCAESIMSVHRRCAGNLSEYDSDQLRKNWNEYCATMVNPCSHGDLMMQRYW